jgi:hypothetical protein
MSTTNDVVLNTYSNLNTIAADEELADPFDIGQVVTFDYSELIETGATYETQTARHGTDWRVIETWVYKRSKMSGGFAYKRMYHLEAIGSDATHGSAAEWLVPADEFDGEHGTFDPSVLYD